MTTSEPVIASALLQSKRYDLFHCIKRDTLQRFVSARDIQEPYRFRLVGVEGLVLPCMEEEGGGTASNGKAPVVDLVAEIQMTSIGQDIGVVQHTAHMDVSSGGASAEWNEVIFFPIHVSQMPLDCLVTITVRTPPTPGAGGGGGANDTGGVLGVAQFYPFTSRGELKAGTRRYNIVSPDPAAGVGVGVGGGSSPSPRRQSGGTGVPVPAGGTGGGLSASSSPYRRSMTSPSGPVLVYAHQNHDGDAVCCFSKHR